MFSRRISGEGQEQGTAPITPHARQQDPEQPIHTCQDRASSLPPESRELEPQSGILDGECLVATEQHSNEPDDGQQQIWYVKILFHIRLYGQIEYWRRT